MYSSRMFAIVALVTAVTSYPVEEKLVRRSETRITDVNFENGDTYIVPLIPSSSNYGETGMKIEGNKFRVIENIKGYKKDDFTVKVKNGYIYIQGMAKDSDHDVFAIQFFYSQSLPTNTSASDVIARLYSDGYLVITLTLNVITEKIEDTEIEVPVIEESEPFKKKIPRRSKNRQPPTNRAISQTPILPTELKNNLTNHQQRYLNPMVRVEESD